VPPAPAPAVANQSTPVRTPESACGGNGSPTSGTDAPSPETLSSFHEIISNLFPLSEIKLPKINGDLSFLRFTILLKIPI
jgi:hypothetical protein